MEENQSQFQTPSSENTNNNVSFPSVSNQQPKKSGGSKVFLVLGLLVVVGVVGFLIYKNSSSNEETPEPSVTESPVQTPIPSPTATSKPIDKTKVKIEIQNGTGITGEAAYLQTQLKTLDYENFVVGNASSQNETTTTVTFSKTLAQSAVDELTTKLKELYKTVEVKTSSTLKTDVLIVTGLKKGATAKASATASAKASATATSTAKASATATSSASPTPTSTTN